MTNKEQLQENNERIEALTLLIQSKAAGSVPLTADSLIGLLEDSETIVSMLTDDGSKVKLQLSASQVNRLMKALTTPTIAPSETELVAIDDGNSQVLLTIGEGLLIEDGELKSTVAGFDGDFNKLTNVPTASEGTKGLIQIASDLDVVAGTNTTKAINAKQLNVAIQGLGTVFRIKGSKQLAAELPSTGNTIGDVWYVSDESVGYIWINDGTKERWEQLGLPIDLTNYALKSDLADYLSLKTGGTVNGTVSAGTLVSSGTVRAQHLQTQAAGHETGIYDKIATLSYEGYVRHRTKDEMKSDLGVVDKEYVDNAVATKANTADLANYIPQGGTLSSPLKVTGGDQATAGKIILDQANKGQITNTETATLFGFTNTTEVVAGHSSYGLRLRGKTSRPLYNGNEIALSNDIPTFSLDGTTLTITLPE